MDSLIFELQIVFYFQLFLSANVRHRKASKTVHEWNSHLEISSRPQEIENSRQ